MIDLDLKEAVLMVCRLKRPMYLSAFCGLGVKAACHSTEDILAAYGWPSTPWRSMLMSVSSTVRTKFEITTYLFVELTNLVEKPVQLVYVINIRKSHAITNILCLLNHYPCNEFIWESQNRPHVPAIKLSFVLEGSMLTISTETDPFLLLTNRDDMCFGIPVVF